MVCVYFSTSYVTYEKNFIPVHICPKKYNRQWIIKSHILIHLAPSHYYIINHIITGQAYGLLTTKMLGNQRVSKFC